MVNALFDTNILLDYLKGVSAARSEIARYDDIAISVVTRIEVLVGTEPDEEASTRAFLDRFTIIELDEKVSERAVVLRKKYRLKLSDAIIWASAQVHGRLFVTRDMKDFPSGEADVRLPYKI
jgi:predicted nucleic acid-binding protein